MKKKFAQIVVKNIKYTVTDAVIDSIKTPQADNLGVSNIEKENERNIERIRNRNNLPIFVVNPTDNSLICTIPIVFKGRLFIAEFPNLITLYLNNAIVSFNDTYEILEDIQNQKGYISNAAIQFNNQTFYNTYLLNRINIVVYLAMTLELLLNSQIPGNYQYKKKELILSKKDIEERLPFKEKLRLVSNLIASDNKQISKTLFDSLIELYSLRSNLVHPKTSSSKLQDDYAMESISVTFSEKMAVYIDAVIEVINLLQPTLINFETTK